ncbi:hypothetical protein GCM10009558_020860 [Virgisporangium aurantiacum]
MARLPRPRRDSEPDRPHGPGLNRCTKIICAAEPELGGLFERIALWPGYLWLGMAGVIVLRGPRHQ